MCHALYLCLDSSCSIRPQLCWTLTELQRPGGLLRADTGCRVLTYEKPNITLQWNTSFTCGGKAGSYARGIAKKSEQGHEKVWGRKNKRANEGFTPHPVRTGRWVSKLPSPTVSSSSLVHWPKQLIVVSAGLRLNSSVRENLFSIRLFPVKAGNSPPHKACLCEGTKLLSLLLCFRACTTTGIKLGDFQPLTDLCFDVSPCHV